jgi:hypothetical protein
MERLDGVCSGKLLWIWGLYAFLMVLLSHAMAGAGFSQGEVWAAAGLIGVALLVWTKEI